MLKKYTSYLSPKNTTVLSNYIESFEQKIKNSKYFYLYEHSYVWSWVRCQEYFVELLYKGRFRCRYGFISEITGEQIRYKYLYRNHSRTKVLDSFAGYIDLASDKLPENMKLNNDIFTAGCYKGGLQT